jgi:hypothetical protein
MEFRTGGEAQPQPQLQALPEGEEVISNPAVLAGSVGDLGPIDVTKFLRTAPRDGESPEDSMRTNSLESRFIPFRLLWLTFLLGGLAALPSCVVHEPIHEGMMEYSGAPEEIVVGEEPPPPREEVVVGVAPSPDHVWVGGYWTYHHSNWFWVRGQWAVSPRPRAHWIAGHWDRHPRGWIWVGGRWR